MYDIDNIKYPFNVKKMDVEGHKFYVIESCSLKGLSAQGGTLIDALKLFAELESEWLETAKQYNIPIPEEIKIKDSRLEVHAKWQDDRCTHCGAYVPTDNKRDYIPLEDNLYCYNCGARMGGDKDNNVRNLTDEEIAIYKRWIESEAKDTGVNTMDGDTEELNKRINDAFTELDTQRNRMSGLTRENSELRQEIIRLESRINKTNNFIEFVLMTYLFVAIAKLIVALIT